MSGNEANAPEAMRYLAATTHKPCPTRDNVLCTITDPTHRHVAAHMVSRADHPCLANGVNEIANRAGAVRVIGP